MYRQFSESRIVTPGMYDDLPVSLLQGCLERSPFTYPLILQAIFLFSLEIQGRRSSTLNERHHDLGDTKPALYDGG